MMSPTSISENGSGNRSLQRGLLVLDCVFKNGSRGIRVVDIMRECELERATVYRILATLLESKYIELQGRFQYVPSIRLLQLSAPPADDVGARLKPVLQHISTAVGDAAFAVVREGTQSHCVARHIGTFQVQVLLIEVGRRQPLGVGAAGLALLASLPVDEAKSIVAANADALKAYGGMQPDRLNLLLRSTRERGWSAVGNYAVPDVLGVGCAVPSPAGAPVAAVSIAAPINRMARKRQLEIIEIIHKAFRRLLPNGLAI